MDRSKVMHGIMRGDHRDEVKGRRHGGASDDEGHDAPSPAEAVASVIHELSQPLTAVMANAHAAMHLLSSASPDVDAARAALAGVLQDCQDAAESVRQMRNLFRRDKLATQPVDLLAIVARTRHLLAEELRRFAIDVKVQIRRTLPVVYGDEHQLRHVLVNLMRNAIESMADNQGHPRELRVMAHRDGDMVLIQIADCGHGLPASTRIFEPFFTTKASGMGIGLRVCQRIVEAHHGRLWAEPRQPRGSVFAFTLPIEGAPLRDREGEAVTA